MAKVIQVQTTNAGMQMVNLDHMVRAYNRGGNSSTGVNIVLSEVGYPGLGSLPVNVTINSTLTMAEFQALLVAPSVTDTYDPTEQ